MCTYLASFTFSFTLWIGTIIFEPHTSRELLKKVKKLRKLKKSLNNGTQVIVFVDCAKFICKMSAFWKE